MKQQNTSFLKQFDKRLNAIDEHIDVINKKAEGLTRKVKEQTEEWKRDAGKYDENKDDQVMNTKVGDCLLYTSP